MGQQIGRYAGEISKEEVQNGRPMLSAILITVGGKPSSGFYDLARALGKLQGDSPQVEELFFHQEQQAIYATWKRAFSAPQHSYAPRIPRLGTCLRPSVRPSHKTANATAPSSAARAEPWRGPIWRRARQPFTTRRVCRVPAPPRRSGWPHGRLGHWPPLRLTLLLHFSYVSLMRLLHRSNAARGILISGWSAAGRTAGRLTDGR